MYKLIILGFDGFDSGLFEASSLPALRKLRETSQWGTLYSEEMRTGPCWTTILTGWNIETHGVTHLLGYPIGGSESFNGRPRDYIFDELNKSKYSVGVANFPSLLHARRLKGWMMAGWPNQPDIYPNRLKIPLGLYSDLPDYERRELESRKPAGAKEDWSIHEVPWKEYIRWAVRNALSRLYAIDALPKTKVLMVQESVLDRAGHMLSTPNKGRLGTDDPRYKQALMLVNNLVDYVMSTYTYDYLAIVSDHGFQGLSVADSEKGCWHSHNGVWAISGPDIVNTRNDTEQVNFMPTILDALGIETERDGYSVLIKNDVESQLKGLGYL
ncbi:MAG: alkaline phosphatase family protein [Candidatus Thorarchaeota archaeon]|jgi:predicted AlkP superfamily phosphohydrolase/phosphomutase